MNIVQKRIDEIKPYEKNPRKNDSAVDYVAKSIKEFGFKVPIVIDKDGIIIAGHTRYKASKKLGLKEVPCIVADDLTEEQVKAFRLADNKVGEIAEWDMTLLGEELLGIEDLDMSDFGFELFDEEEIEDEEDNPYTTKVNIPQYEITGEEPDISELVDTTKADKFEKKISEYLSENKITEEQADFLIKATKRHNVFNYSKIAEYYAHQDKAMQELMEESALVIIDFDDAIKNGYVSLQKGIQELEEEDYED